MSHPLKLCSKKELKTVYGIPYSFQHIARLEAAGRFPRRIRLGTGPRCRVAWRCGEIAAWIQIRILNTAIERQPEEDEERSS
jgi:prophage regulatory protein